MKPRKRKCKHCGTQYQPFNSMQKACSVPCAAALGKAAKERKDRQRTAEDKERIKTLTTVCSEAQKDVNRYIMAQGRRLGLTCISCGSPNISDAGHYYHAGSKYRSSLLRFMHINIAPQCKSCNSFKGGGNQDNYRLGIIARHGEERFKQLEAAKLAADRGELPSVTKDEAREIARIHRIMTKAVKSN